MIVYRPNDRIPVTIGEVTFWISPLTIAQKTLLLSLVQQKEGGHVFSPWECSEKNIKMSLKKIEGLETADGKPYKLSFDDKGELTDDCVTEIFNIGNIDKLIRILGMFALDEIKETNLEGVSVDLKRVHSVKKKVKSPTAKTE